MCLAKMRRRSSSSAAARTARGRAAPRDEGCRLHFHARALGAPSEEARGDVQPRRPHTGRRGAMPLPHPRDRSRRRRLVAGGIQRGWCEPVVGQSGGARRRVRRRGWARGARGNATSSSPRSSRHSSRGPDAQSSKDARTSRRTALLPTTESIRIGAQRVPKAPCAIGLCGLLDAVGVHLPPRARAENSRGQPRAAEA